MSAKRGIQRIQQQCRQVKKESEPSADAICNPQSIGNCKIRKDYALWNERSRTSVSEENLMQRLAGSASHHVRLRTIRHE